MERFLNSQKPKQAALMAVQITGLTALYWASALLVTHLKLPIPATVLGMGILFLLLLSGTLPVRFVEKGARLLVNHLTFFFIPIAVGLMAYGELIQASGFALLVMIAGSSLIGLLVTAAVSILFSKGKRKKA